MKFPSSFDVLPPFPDPAIGRLYSLGLLVFWGFFIGFFLTWLIAIGILSIPLPFAGLSLAIVRPMCILLTVVTPSY